jgi:bifunctional non-homologous end joining protein LigD
MLATPGRLPPDDDRYLYEVKFDGWRVLLYGEAGRAQVLSRNGVDLSDRCAELQAIVRRRRKFILDGELVVVGAGGRPDFDALSARMKQASGMPVTLMLFDLLHLDGQDTTRLPLEDRRALLSGLGLNGPHWRTVTYQVGGGAPLLAASREQGLEGLVAKRLGSRYRPGRRSPDWLKLKNWEVSEFVVGAFTEDAVLVGRWNSGRLEYVGRVELGVGQRLLERLRASDLNPFTSDVPRGAQFVDPEVVVEVQHLVAAWPLRHAVVKAVL